MIKYQKIHLTNKAGISLIELIITVALIGVISAVLLSMIFTGIRSYNTATAQIDSFSSARLAYLYLEKQLKTSEKAYWSNEMQRLYVQDMESRNSGDISMFNYYTLEDDIIMRHKVYEDDLDHTIRGGKSQLIKHIVSFNLIKIKNKNAIYINIDSKVENNMSTLESFIEIGTKIITIN